MNAALKALLDQLLNLAVKSWAGLTGIKGYLAKQILKYGGSVIIEQLDLLIKKITRKVKQEKALENLEKVDKDPNSTTDQKGKAYEEMFNSGR